MSFPNGPVGRLFHTSLVILKQTTKARLVPNSTKFTSCQLSSAAILAAQNGHPSMRPLPRHRLNAARITRCNVLPSSSLFPLLLCAPGFKRVILATWYEVSASLGFNSGAGSSVLPRPRRIISLHLVLPRTQHFSRNSRLDMRRKSWFTFGSNELGIYLCSCNISIRILTKFILT